MAKMTREQELQFFRDMNMREKLRQEIINQMWDLWITITFPYIAGEDSTINRIKEFFVNINRIAKFQLVDKRTYIFICIDNHETKKGCHAHLFLRGINPIHANTVQSLLEKEIGISLVKPYDSTRETPTRGASAYVAKKYGTQSFVSSRWLTLHPKFFKSSPNNLVAV